MTKLGSSSLLTLCLTVLSSAKCISALSATVGDESLTRALLKQAFASPSGKLTYGPELVIPEPKDPTAMLLQSNTLQGLSSKVRAAKTNFAFLQGSLTALQTVCNEQETAKGNFPGPVPVIYCLKEDKEGDIEKVADAGADAVLISVTCQECADGTVDLLGGDDTPSWVLSCQQALQYGMQPIPELIMSESTVQAWNDGENKEQAVPDLIEKVSELLGADPVAVVLTIEGNEEEGEEENDDEESSPVELKPVALPFVPKDLKKRTCMIGSVQVPAGEGRLSMESNRFKEAGFNSGFLRSSCVPGFRIQLDLESVAKFWAGCIVDLKSTKSRSFSFRSKNNMETSAMTNWGNYQKSVVESGALGDPNDTYSVVDADAGEYMGF